MRVKVTLTQDCIAWVAGSEVNIHESELYRFESMYTRETKDVENKAILKPKKTKSIK